MGEPKTVDKSESSIIRTAVFRTWFFPLAQRKEAYIENSMMVQISIDERGK
jgi:hypothetical protein